MRYFSFFGTRSLNSNMYFTLAVYLNLDEPHFKRFNSYQENECCIGQHEFGRFLWKANEYSVLWVLPSLTVFFYSLDTY